MVLAILQNYRIHILSAENAFEGQELSIAAVNILANHHTATTITSHLDLLEPD